VSIVALGPAFLALDMTAKVILSMYIPYSVAGEHFYIHKCALRARMSESLVCGGFNAGELFICCYNITVFIFVVSL